MYVEVHWWFLMVFQLMSNYFVEVEKETVQFKEQ